MFSLHQHQLSLRKTRIRELEKLLTKARQGLERSMKETKRVVDGWEARVLEVEEERDGLREKMHKVIHFNNKLKVSDVIQPFIYCGFDPLWG